MINEKFNAKVLRIDSMTIDLVEKIEELNYQSFNDEKLENLIEEYWGVEDGILCLDLFQEIITRYNSILKE
jgi:hypothetical protein